MVFSLRQLQEKCQEQQMPLYLAFIDLTKAFDMVSRSGLFQLLKKIGCPPHLLAVVTSFHYNMRSTVSFNGVTSRVFSVSSGVKQGCVLAPTLFGIFFSMLLQYAFKDCSEGVYIHTRADGKLLNIARLRAKTKVREVLIREMLFADDAALASHTEEGLQQLVSRFSAACKEDMKQCNIDVSSWESLAEDRPSWRSTVKSAVKEAEDARNAALAEKRRRRKQRERQPQQQSTFVCDKCQRDCHSRPKKITARATSHVQAFGMRL
ncbi:uncharacterized protein LOC125029522 [Penaeus chinensis]|uniref:uncharacterized protein LOC125029522 n=1 Tax=Penaeus chinensis TaxID=139456 RepID=UPI001FB67224|nr:uncharacterized protein LOC125029522 [Penaeus chinensis]